MLSNTTVPQDAISIKFHLAEALDSDESNESMHINPEGKDHKEHIGEAECKTKSTQSFPSRYNKYLFELLYNQKSGQIRVKTKESEKLNNSCISFPSKNNIEDWMQTDTHKIDGIGNNNSSDKIGDTAIGQVLLITEVRFYSRGRTQYI